MKRTLFLPSDTASLTALGVIDPRAYGAGAQGITDDTAAVQAAVSASLSGNRYADRQIVRFAPGVYKISDTIRMINSAGDWTVGCYISGAPNNQSQILLAANTPGFTNASSPKPIFMTGDQHAGKYPAVADGIGNTSGNASFNHTFSGLWFRIETGNAGAVCIDYQTSNEGCITGCLFDNVGTAALYGVRMHRGGFGQGLIDNCTFSGFVQGINSSQGYDYGLAIYGCSFQKFTNAGIGINGLPTTITKCSFAISETYQAGIVMGNAANSTHCVLGCTFVLYSVNGATPSAIYNLGARVVLQDNTDTIANNIFYQDTLRSVNLTNPTTYSTQVVNHTPAAIPAVATGYFASPTENTNYDLDYSYYVKLTDFAPGPGNDWGVAFNLAVAACNAPGSNRYGIVIPRGIYNWGTTGVISGQVFRVIGLCAGVVRINNFTGPIFQTGYQSIAGLGFNPHLMIQNMRCESGALVYSQVPVNTTATDFVTLVADCYGRIEADRTNTRVVACNHLGTVKATNGASIRIYSSNAEYEDFFYEAQSGSTIEVFGSKHEPKSHIQYQGSNIVKAGGGSTVRHYGGYMYGDAPGWSNPWPWYEVADSNLYAMCQFGGSYNGADTAARFVDNGVTTTYTINQMNSPARAAIHVNEVNN